MSLWPAYFSARKRKDEPAPTTQPGPEVHDDRPQDRAFDLLPPEEPAKSEPPADPLLRVADPVREPVAAPEPEPLPEPERPAELEPEPPPAAAAVQAPAGRNVHNIGISDLNRLSIDRDGRLYWDGKPVEVRRRVSMSRAQIASALVIAAFVVIGAIGAAINGTAAALDWACRVGWTTSYCGPPEAPAPQRPEIPA